jgi:DNA polymerase III epsilon subunit-like protein
MKYCSIDVETTGLNPETCDLLEVGAVVDDLDNPIDAQLLPTFHCYVVKPNYRGEPFALSMHPTIFRRIAEKTPPYNYLPECMVAEELRLFLKRHFGEEKVTVAGKNFLGLDKPFLAKLKGFDMIKLHHRPLDPGMLYWKPRIDKEVPSSKECMTRAGLAGEVAHTAVEDALMVVKLIRNKVFG